MLGRCCNSTKGQWHNSWNQEVGELIQEVYVENTWQAAALQQQRDERYQELEALGYACEHKDLYRLDGLRVFLVTATLVEQSTAATESNRTDSLPISRPRDARAAGAGQATPAPQRRSPQAPRKGRAYEER